MRLLLVEDDVFLGSSLSEFLAREGYEVDWAQRGSEALERMRQATYPLVILDLNLPDMSGLEVLRMIRRDKMQMFVMSLTARDTLHDRVEGLDAGADDYLTKPFELQELAARLRALSRRAEGQLTDVLSVGELTLDLKHREVLYKGAHLTLSAREFALLERLMARAGHVVTKQQMVQSLSVADGEISDNAIEVYVYRLRKRLEDVNVEIHTIRGFGYLLDVQ
ncbi:Transcriptional regulatory protein QseB [Oligella urethralis]|uniref:response regulator n=1 Tax=Oligella urethralis TaxID=90245 RepID=UPI0006600927|nr:response regulator transcription factor [Oligella urethralis]WOS38053.1 Transcriptional regulatory protein QseB [Oligella urethralis]